MSKKPEPSRSLYWFTSMGHMITGELKIHLGRVSAKELDRALAYYKNVLSVPFTLSYVIDKK